MNGQPGRLVLELTCVVGAPRERTFNSLTESAELARWWGQHGVTTPEIALDLSVGGHWGLGKVWGRSSLVRGLSILR